MTAEVKVEEKQVESEVVIASAVVPPVEETTVKAVVEDEVKAVEEVDGSETKVVEKSSSFKEESDFFSDLKDSEKKALSDLKTKLEEAIVENTLFRKKKETPVKVVEKKKVVEEKAEDEKKSEAVVTEEAKAEESPKEEAKTDAVVTEEAKAEATEDVVQKESPKEEVKTEADIVDTKEEVKAEIAEEEKKTEEAVVTKEADVVDPKEEVKAEIAEEEKKTEEAVVTKEATVEQEEEDEIVDNDIELWGVPLLPSKGAEGTDVILLKFLRARDFKVNDAFEMLKKTLKWRKEQKINSVLGRDFGEDLASAAYMNGLDRESRPVCYNVYSVFGNEELYQATFGSEQSRENLLKWRFQLMEKGTQKLDLKPGGVTSLLQIHDLKNCPGPLKKELWVAIKNAIVALQDNYPELVSRNVFINVPFWFYAVSTLLSPFLTQRTKSKFVVPRPANVTETLLKYIPAEEIPVQYGGFKRDDDTEFSKEAVSEVVVKPGSSETIEIPATETEGTLVWDVAVLGWEVNYKEEFVPADEGAYTIIVQKVKKIGSNEGPVRNSFKNSESGKIVLTVDNVSSKKKKRVLYRYRTKTESSC
ncbi:PREDICTED: patellin-4-like isoform X3 [Brassica oleracea var. oleracea]|uniref:patellin-4-like isoform X2 n=1 Tax=Brassica oleracea var. oleracea TaxID=109376 RepID=UPI0006A75394|nr:PREDICTED: patellin-4-like isoform X2 [Brassica oleracea var. oleracea]XP_013598651.1 PREDICTED: patellin-4-like isoform X3 [Brassica oleracea var. oleracea]